MSLVIQKLRLQRGWSQQQLADFSGLSVRTVQRIESGQRATAESLKSLAAVFEVEFQELRTAMEEASPAPTSAAEARPAPPEASIMTTTLNPSPAPSPPPTDFAGRSREARLGMSDAEVRAYRDVRKLRGFYMHLFQYVVVIGVLAVINASSPGRWWVQWPAMGWGIGIVAHGLSIWRHNPLFGAEWERRQIEKRLGRKLVLIFGATLALGSATDTTAAGFRRVELAAAHGTIEVAICHPCEVTHSQRRWV